MDTMYLNELQAVAIEIVRRLAAPRDAVSINTFLKKSGETILVVHLAPKYRHLAAQVPNELNGVKVECDIGELAVMN